MKYIQQTGCGRCSFYKKVNILFSQNVEKPCSLNPKNTILIYIWNAYLNFSFAYQEWKVIKPLIIAEKLKEDDQKRRMVLLIWLFSYEYQISALTPKGSSWPFDWFCFGSWSQQCCEDIHIEYPHSIVHLISWMIADDREQINNWVIRYFHTH